MSARTIVDSPFYVIHHCLSRTSDHNRAHLTLADIDLLKYGHYVVADLFRINLINHAQIGIVDPGGNMVYNGDTNKYISDFGRGFGSF